MGELFIESLARRRERGNIVQIGTIAICGSFTIVRSSSASRYGRLVNLILGA